MSAEQIDAEKLADAITYYDRDCQPTVPQFYTILEAARAHLSTLPRVKEVEIEQWVSVNLKGEVEGCWDHESQARKSVGSNDRLSIVRLTGTAKVRA